MNSAGKASARRTLGRVIFQPRPPSDVVRCGGLLQTGLGFTGPCAASWMYGGKQGEQLGLLSRLHMDHWEKVLFVDWGSGIQVQEGLSDVGLKACRLGS